MKIEMNDLQWEVLKGMLKSLVTNHEIGYRWRAKRYLEMMETAERENYKHNLSTSNQTRYLHINSLDISA